MIRFSDELFTETTPVHAGILVVWLNTRGPPGTVMWRGPLLFYCVRRWPNTKTAVGRCGYCCVGCVGFVLYHAVTSGDHSPAWFLPC